ncbi:MAG: MATE family efflux transporter [Ruminococcus flavefaciens]|jgi:putative MATE family efflux protein|nr:MATE family efflux transporter [Ruminococcus flavefaciens]
MSGNIDFTQGKPSRAILRFFFPMLATGMLQQFYSFADTAIVGRGLGDNALAAVGNMGSLCFLIIGFSMGLANGFSVLIAQRYGEKNFSELRRTMSAMVRLAAMITGILTILSIAFLYPVLKLMQTDKSIIGDSLTYGYILFGGLSSTIFYNMSAGILRSLGDSKTPLRAIVVSSLLNITMDSFFILVLHTGVWGAAAATVVSQIISGTVCLQKLRSIDFLKKQDGDFKPDGALYGQLMKNGVPMALMNSITAIGCMAVQYYVNGLGVAFTSAYSACSKYINMFMQPACTAGFAMSAYTGQNFGAKRFDRIGEGLKVCLFIALTAYAVLGTVMTFFPEWLASRLLSGREQITYAAEFLPICGAMLFAVDMLFVFRNAVQGMGFPLVPMISGIAEMVLRIGTISLLIGQTGFKATAYAEICAWTGALVLNASAYKIIFAREKEANADDMSYLSCMPERDRSGEHPDGLSVKY